MQRRTLGLSLVAILFLAGAAHADPLSFTFSGAGYGYSITGTGTATSSSQPGVYQVTSLNGGGSGTQIVSLIAPSEATGSDDLLFSSSSSVFDASGLSFLMSNGSQGEFSVNLFADPTSASGYSAFLQNPDGSGETIPLTSFAATFPTSVSTQVTPEPSSLWLLGTGLLALAGFLSYRLRHPVSPGEDAAAAG